MHVPHTTARALALTANIRTHAQNLRRNARKVTAWAVMLVAVVCAATIPLGLRHSLSAIGVLDHRRERDLVANFVERSKFNAVTQQKAQLTWDDAFRQTRGKGDAAWQDVNIGQFLSNTFGFDTIFLVTADGDLIRGWHQGKVAIGPTYAPIEAQVRATLRGIDRGGRIFGNPAGLLPLADTRWPFDASGAPLTRWSAEIIRYNGQPALITVESILPDVDFRLLRERPRYVVAIRYLDAKFAEDVGRGLLLRDVAIADAPPSAGAAGAAGNALAIRDRSGVAVAWLTWKPGNLASRIENTFVPILLAYGAGIVILLVVGLKMMRRMRETMGELRASEAQARHNVMHDSLTGLPNRRFLYDYIERKLPGLQSGHEGGWIAVAFFDLDHFKLINDTLGHHIGDELLRQVALRLSARMPAGDVVARLGGDEFVVVRMGLAADGNREELGEEIRETFLEPFEVCQHTLRITSSCGVSWAPEHTIDAGVLIRNADIALYRAKQRGRARWRAFMPHMEAEIRWRRDLETELRQALARDEMRLVYQPLVTAEDQRTVAFEALMRWNHPARGEVGPAVFIPVAEQSGLMVELGRWLIARAFAEARQLAGHSVSINLSPSQILARGFVDEIRAIARELEVDTTRIIFEITEGVMIDRSDQAMQAMQALKAIGFKIALDDFGTGFSSLGYLRAFPFDYIKIDRLFVQNIEHDSRSREFLGSMSSMIRTLDMKMVVEGVETRGQFEIARLAGCSLMQGFYFAQPQELAELLAAPATPSNVTRIRA